MIHEDYKTHVIDVDEIAGEYPGYYATEVEFQHQGGRVVSIQVHFDREVEAVDEGGQD